MGRLKLGVAFETDLNKRKLMDPKVLATEKAVYDAMLKLGVRSDEKVESLSAEGRSE